MNKRIRLDAELENLERMLSDWRGTLRDEAQFGPQFDALAQEIIMRADPADRDHARSCIARMRAMQLPSHTDPR
ncbi:MAG: hypothetical protein ABI858_05940 [Pseudoxanthomonas sp.]